MKKRPNRKCWTLICLIVWLFANAFLFLKKSFLLVLRWESGQIENVGHPTNQTMQSSEFTIDLHKNLHWINKTFLLRINLDSISIEQHSEMIIHFIRFSEVSYEYNLERRFCSFSHFLQLSLGSPKWRMHPWTGQKNIICCKTSNFI